MAQEPEWLAALAREARVRSGLVVYGNTRDLFWSGNGPEYVTLPALLAKRLDAFGICATWDRVDGLRFASDEQARRWREAVERSVGSGTATGKPYDVGGAGTPDPAPTSARRIQLRELIAEYRAVVRRA